ncbi:hypothetical protein [Cloacibacillus sp. An23]|uniref:hypothetical protein n=1 Tax=Cloacibacillus sp. An23 TaxID=1965591 RepID=UPI000B3876C0|nr:hypothetical protein [Cloacibacillus sp. An23]OUO94762.1 hypothetical protein B5F39_02525 [Cloacibacillus sp. An23]
MSRTKTNTKTKRERFRGDIEDVKAYARKTGSIDQPTLIEMLDPVTDLTEAVQMYNSKVCNAAARQAGLIAHRQGNIFVYTLEEQMNDAAKMSAVGFRCQWWFGAMRKIRKYIFELTAQLSLFGEDEESMREKLNFIRKIRNELRGALKVFSVAERRLSERIRREEHIRERRAG